MAMAGESGSPIPRRGERGGDELPGGSSCFEGGLEILSGRIISCGSGGRFAFQDDLKTSPCSNTFASSHTLGSWSRHRVPLGIVLIWKAKYLNLLGTAPPRSRRTGGFRLHAFQVLGWLCIAFAVARAVRRPCAASKAAALPSGQGSPSSISSTRLFRSRRFRTLRHRDLPSTRTRWTSSPRGPDATFPLTWPGAAGRGPRGNAHDVAAAVSRCHEHDRLRRQCRREPFSVTFMASKVAGLTVSAARTCLAVMAPAVRTAGQGLRLDALSSQETSMGGSGPGCRG